MSLAMIVRDSEDMIERCLKSVAGLCDELIVVDTGSVDDTRDSARKMGAKVYEFEWIDDFSAARNRSFELCTSDWIIWLDSDDTISAASRDALIKLKNTKCNDELDTVVIPYHYNFDEFDNNQFFLYRERLLRRQANPRWQYPVHECIAVPPERTLRVHDIFIEHRPTKESLLRKPAARNLNILEKAISAGDNRPRMQFYYANELFDNGRIEESIPVYEGFLLVADRGWEKYHAIRRLSVACQKTENEEKALNWAKAAIETAPERAEAYVETGTIYFKRGETQLAIPFFLKAIELEVPATSFVNPDAYGWLPHDFLAACYLAEEEYGKALEAAISALERNPGEPRLKENVDFLRRLATVSD
jgi:Glycosyltransferases involved in cell wall biogenesis